MGNARFVLEIFINPENFFFNLFYVNDLEWKIFVEFATILSHLDLF